MIRTPVQANKNPRRTVKKEENEEESFTPYPISRLSTTLASTTENLMEIESASTESLEKSNKSFTLVDVEIVSTTALSTTFADYPDESSSPTMNPTTTQDETSIASSTKFIDVQNMTEVSVTASTPRTMTSSESSSTTERHVEEMESTTIRPLSRKSTSLKRRDGFNCLGEGDVPFLW
ncbi:microtubule-associated protein futsch-like isoform X1 [Apis mellifera carnica]|nr:microtubule-associated protein futsch-like isoform X1 [Apis mellifera carnica]